MRDGLYRLRFQGPRGWGAGILFVTGENVRGGDGGFYYFGSVARDGDKVEIRVETRRHSQSTGLETIFGLDEVHVTLTGSLAGERILCDGSVAEMPGAQFLAELSWLSE